MPLNVKQYLPENDFINYTSKDGKKIKLIVSADISREVQIKYKDLQSIDVDNYSINDYKKVESCAKDVLKEHNDPKDVDTVFDGLPNAEKDKVITFLFDYIRIANTGDTQKKN